jgi:aflatoxin B1 aldehyde reductase
MTLGKAGTEQARVQDLPTGSALTTPKSHGHSKIDTASSYGEGSSEKMLAQPDMSARNLHIATKYYPTFGRAVPSSWDPNLRQTPTGLRENLTASLKALNADKLEAVNTLHQEGLFTRLGLSNY